MWPQSATASARLSNSWASARTRSAPEAAGPAAGLGQPSRGATSRISVSPKLSMARAALPMFSPSCGRTRTIAGASVPADIAHAAGEFLEVPRFREVAVDRGEADVGDRIELAQALHHHLADPRGGHFAFARGLDLPLDPRHELVEPFLRYPALAAGEGDRLLELGAVERFPPVAALDHRDLAQLHPLERGEAPAAALALAAAADRGVVLGRPRIL